MPGEAQCGDAACKVCGKFGTPFQRKPIPKAHFLVAAARQGATIRRPRKRSHRIAMSFHRRKERRIRCGQIMDKNSVSPSEGEKFAIRSEREGEIRPVGRRQIAQFHFTRGGSPGERLAVVGRTLSDPSRQQRDLIRGKLLFRRHVRVRLRIEHFQKEAFCRAICIHDKSIGAARKKLLATGEVEFALVIFRIMAAETLGVEEEHRIPSAHLLLGVEAGRNASERRDNTAP